LQVVCAGSAHEALELLSSAQERGQPFKLLLSDVHMPQEDGFDLVEQIKKQPKLAGSVIMMLTSGGQRGDATRCRNLGVAAYLTKPVRAAELQAAISAILSASLQQDSKSCDIMPQPITRHSLREARSRTSMPLSVLLAEDNAVNQRLALRILEKQGHRVVVADNGKKALAAVETQKFDLVLMDVQMPEMDGLEATAAIRALERGTGDHLPIIAMTAHAMQGDRQWCLEAGMDAYISKPIRARDLLDVVESYCEQ
jgi:two-component system sensor histidine kinase/response regulator